MKQAVLFLLVVLGCARCASPDPATSEAPAVPLPPAPSSSSTYWPVDPEIDQRDTLLPGPDRYRVRVVTTCLNDSAVLLSPVEGDTSPERLYAHNYHSKLVITRAGHPWANATLSKTLFRNHPVLQGFVPLPELALSRTAYLRRQRGEFVFYTRLGVPDSDIFVEAEVALNPATGLRVVQVMEQVNEPDEE
ncbi:hypothetical protein [Hymenobacter lapidiphilus]|uniref:DUF4738 domain-containing protein n=1 Tax=Hymenobacter lapidiphilus TaxID=2608003 RepID=A0A7Y7PS79_9BACT|nr:hypothetical protein [Hymenobacter lapidiphilus]NVO32884.1 hypothetical protein [Hymenobacter lapidiphilus]